MKAPRKPADAWPLLVRFFFAQRAHIPTLAAELELSAAQCHVLHLIEPGPGVPMGRLAERLACDASNVTGLIDRLESRGLVRRCPSERDRRIKVLQLTPAGLRIRDTLAARMATPPPILDRLSARERQALIRILRRLLDHPS